MLKREKMSSKKRCKFSGDVVGTRIGKRIALFDSPERIKKFSKSARRQAQKKYLINFI